MNNENIEVLLFKIPKNSDLKLNQKVAYQNMYGAYSKLGIITDILGPHKMRVETHYLINNAMGSYVASELRLTQEK
jgi:hypothetical protein